MKRTKADEIVASFLERYVFADQGRDVDARSDFAKNALVVSHLLRKTSSRARRFPRRRYAKPCLA